MRTLDRGIRTNALAAEVEGGHKGDLNAHRASVGERVRPLQVAGIPAKHKGRDHEGDAARKGFRLVLLEESREEREELFDGLHLDMLHQVLSFLLDRRFCLVLQQLGFGRFRVKLIGYGLAAQVSRDEAERAEHKDPADDVNCVVDNFHVSISLDSSR